MLGDWQTLYTEDEKMGAGVGPLLLELVGDLTAEAHASLLKTVGSRKQNPYANAHHLPVPKTHFEQGQALPVSYGEMQGPEEERDRPNVTFLLASFTIAQAKQPHLEWCWTFGLIPPTLGTPCPSPSKSWP